jgi:hypothetical protein
MQVMLPDFVLKYWPNVLLPVGRSDCERDELRSISFGNIE